MQYFYINLASQLSEEEEEEKEEPEMQSKCGTYSDKHCTLNPNSTNKSNELKS